MTKSLPYWVSKLGHPIVLGTVLALYINFHYFSLEEAKQLSIRLIAGIVVPLCIYVFFQIRRGFFKDFDVSDTQKRNKLYEVLLLLIALQIFLYFLLGGNPLILSGFVMVGIYIVICYFLNRKGFKVSLHTSFAFLTSVLSFLLAAELSVGLFLFALLVAYSRVLLGRHSFIEVVVGAIIGIGLGLIFNNFVTI